MSEYLEFRTTFRNKESLVAALADVGFVDVESHEEAQQLRGYGNDLREDKAHIIIRKKYVGRVSNDIGFRKNDDGTYEAIISEYDRSRFNRAWLDRVGQNYAVNVIRQKAKRKGYRVSETRVGGKIQMTLRKG